MSTGTDYQPIDRVGDFRGRIIEYRACEGKEGTMNVALVALVTGYWDTEANDGKGGWDDSWEQYQMTAEGLMNLLKKDHKLNESNIRSLVQNAGWDGRIVSVYDQSWQPTPISFNVVQNEYKGQTNLQIGWVNPYDADPGSRKTISEEKARAFDTMYGANLRAIAGNVTRNAPAAAPAGKPSAPKGTPGARKSKSPPKAPAAAVASGDGEQQGTEPIPF